ncbi:MAG: prepilin peptidase [Bacillota bacterium]
MAYLLIIVLGFIIGSFLNAVIYRVPRGESIVRPGSSCPACGARLNWFELVPVLSYLFLRGRCRHCGVRISPRYPAVEVLTAALFLTVYVLTLRDVKTGTISDGTQLALVLSKRLFLTAGLIAVSFTDLEHRRIPNLLVLALLAGAVVLVPLAGDVEVIQAALGCLAAGGALLLLGILFKDGMGGGDIKLAAVAGLYLGWGNAVLGLFLGALSGSVIGVSLIIAGRKTRKDFIPFGPFLAAGFFVSMLWGGEIVRWYLSYYGIR